MEKAYALSVKQPWAALLVLGLKAIEIRRWPTARRGRVLIHAARVPDERPEAWAHVTPAAEALASLRGGIIGAAELTRCVEYRTAEAFAIDQSLHLNELAWYQPPVLYGFTFADPEVLPFQAYTGWFRFFPVEPPPAPAS